MTDPGSAHFDHVLGTSLDVQWTVEPGTPDPAPRVEKAVLGEIARLERILSTHKADTELSHWLQTRGAETPVSADLAHVLSSALRWLSVTRGGFDPAFSGGANGPSPSDPDAPPWSVRHEGGRHMALKRTGAALGFDGVAKGYVVDRAAEAVTAVPGVLEVIVNLGGDIRHIGAGEVVLGVTDPAIDAENAPPLTRLRVSGHGVATSGGHRRGESRDGVWHSHLIHPSTGQTAQRTVSATVIASCTEDADALATAFTVLDPEQSIPIADSLPDVACLILDPDGRRFQSARWARYEIPGPSAAPGRAMSRREMLTRFLPAGIVAGGLVRSPIDRLRRVPWDESFELRVEFDFGDPRGGTPGRRPYVVVYIDLEDGTPVRTLSLWSQQASWVRELRRWHRAERARQSEHGGDLVMSIASPTRGAGHFSVVWDGRDDQGELVEQGEYFVCLETVRQGSHSYFTRAPFTFESSPFQAQIEDYAGFRDIQLDYRQRS